MDKQALKPIQFSEFASLGAEESQPEESKNLLEDEQKAKAYVSNLKGWKLHKAFIERIEKELDDMVLGLIQNGASEAEVGQKTIVKEIVKNVTRRIIDDIESARGDK